MDTRDLFDKLLRAEHEDEVEHILQAAGFGLENGAAWRPLGDMENNFATVGNQQTEATGAMVEKIINAIDALLMAECFSRGIDPEGPDAPRSMAAAVETFFKVSDGRLENLTPGQQTDLAQRINLVATGDKASPCYLILDQGEGQTPDAFPDTLVSLKRSNKLRIPFVQGKYNSGGTGVLQFCGSGDRNFQLIASRRHPKAPVAPGDRSRELWGFTVVRRMKPTAGRKSSMYVYLAPGGAVPRFAGDPIAVLPEKRTRVWAKPYAVEMPHGTCIKLYNFRWKARSIATTEARYELERYLHSPCLPFRVTETRDYRANYFSTTISGIWVSVASAGEEAESAKVELGFPAAGALNLRGIGQLPYRIVVFKEDVDPRHVPHGVFFTINGQVHGGLPSDFVTRHLRFDYLRDHLLVSVDCTAMDDQVREDFFLASRDRVRKNEVYDAITESLRDDLREHQGLRDLNAARRKKQIDQAVSNDKATANVFNDLLKSDPTLSALFALGDRLVTTTGPGPSVPYQGKRFPTFFRIAGAPKKGVVKHCPVNRTCRVVFETDATNDYFSRADCPGHITTDPPNLIEHSHLWNGEFAARFIVPWNIEPGQEMVVKVEVADVETEARESPFVSTFTLVAEPDVDPPPSGPTGKTSRPRSPQNGKRSTPALAIPEVVDEKRPDYPYSALRLSHGSDGGYDFFLNIDNAFLLTEMTRAKEEDRPLVKFWFKYGLTLCALGMIQEGKRRRQEKEAGGSARGPNGNGDGSSEEEEENLERISTYCNGLARVIVPVIRTLYRPPQVATG